MKQYVSSSTDSRPMLIRMETKSPTWVEVLPIYVHYLQNGNLREVQQAASNLRLMAEVADLNSK